MRKSIYPDFGFSDIKVFEGAQIIDEEFAIFRVTSPRQLPIGVVKMSPAMLGVCIQGTMRLVIENKEVELRPNIVFAILPERLVEIRYTSPDFQALHICFSSNFIDEALPHQEQLSNLLVYFVENPIAKFSVIESERMIVWGRQTYQYASMTYHPMRKEIIRSMMSILFFDVSGILMYHLHPKQSTSKGEHLFVQFLRSVSQHCFKERSVSFYANLLGVSPKHLTATITRISGRSSLDWITRYAIIEAKALLKNSDKSIYDISKELNFASQSFFGKFFKANTGLSPNQYRREISEKKKAKTIEGEAKGHTKL